jgi:hypothetical protein
LTADRAPDVPFWTVWEGDTLLGCGALKSWMRRTTHRLYESFGFSYCGPFADYQDDPNSVFMARVL